MPAKRARLAELWRSPDPVVRRLLAWFAAERGKPAAAKELLPGLADEDEDVRLATDRALRVLSGKNAGYDYQAPAAERTRKAKAWARLLRGS